MNLYDPFLSFFGIKETVYQEKECMWVGGKYQRDFYLLERLSGGDSQLSDITSHLDNVLNPIVNFQSLF